MNLVEHFKQIEDDTRLVEYIKQNLSIQIKTCGNQITVKLLFNDEVISESFDSIRTN